MLARSLHDAIHDEEEAIRAAQGLGRSDFTGSLASELDIMEQAMLQAGVPQAKIDELRAQSEAYGARKALPTMTTRFISFSDFTKPSRVGGSPALPESLDWPLDVETSLPLSYLFSIDHRLVEDSASGLSIEEHKRISVFTLISEDLAASRKICRRFRVSDDASFAPAMLPSRVILHDDGPLRHAMPAGTARLGIAGMVVSEAADDNVAAQAPDRSQWVTSKVGGLPSWGQDPVAVPGCRFVLQLNYRAIEMAGPAKFGHALFGGIGYLYISETAIDGDAGVFFIQNT